MSKDKFKKEYIVFIEQVEEKANSVQLILDAIEQIQFEEIREDNIINNDFIQRIPTQIFTLSLTKKQYQALEESSWLYIAVSNVPTEIPVSLYNDVFFSDEPKQLFIENMEPKNIENKKKIFSMDIFDKFKYDEFQLNSSLYSLSQNANKVIVYNVGQGNCNGICNSDGIPLMYFDFGGGVYQNTKTYPGNNENPKQISFCKVPLVLLSHWDWDHMASVRIAKHKDIKDSNWIVPKQEIGITHLKVAVDLHNRGNLKVWPNDLKVLVVNNLEIQKISATDKKDRNNNGLVVTIKINKDSYVLLPADANYDLIDNKKEHYIGLVATHHGAESHGCLNDIPLAKEKGKIVYSFGSNNTYNHPKQFSLDAHSNKGWNNVCFTGDGDVMI